MIFIPEHVKKTVDLIIEEYEKSYRKGECFYSKIESGNNIYVGKETTWYCLEKAKVFREELEIQKSNLFKERDFKVIIQIWSEIQRMYDPLGYEAIARITGNISCQDQLTKALKRARKKEDSEEAKEILNFIETAHTISWSQEDENIKKRIFKLVKTSDELNQILERDSVVELTNPGKKIRIMLEEISLAEQYRSKRIVRSYKNSLKFFYGEALSSAYKAFNFWNDITEKGVYYIYIPENDCK